MTEFFYETVMRMTRAGMTAPEIAKETNRSRKSIYAARFWAKQQRLNVTPEQVSTTRTCLRCREEFEPEHSGLFVCNRCKTSSDWKSGSALI